ncbi:MAG: tetratricopeptide repeat protein [Bradymonadia bacterium]
MYTLFTAIGLGVLGAALPLLFGASLTLTILPGFFVAVIGFVWINRRVGKRVEALTKLADAELANAQAVAGRSGAKAGSIMLRGIDGSISKLKGALVFANWQLGLKAMLNARIGMMLYTKTVVLGQTNKKNAIPETLRDAVPYLEKAQVSGLKAKLLSALWPAWVMLALAHYRLKNEFTIVSQIFEKTVTNAPKNGIVWSMYGWLLVQEKQLDEAISVLARGVSAAPDDPHLKENYNLVQNQKKPRMKAYGEQWYQFGMEQPRVAAGPRTAHPRMKASGRRR